MRKLIVSLTIKELFFGKKPSFELLYLLKLILNKANKVKIYNFQTLTLIESYVRNKELGLGLSKEFQQSSILFSTLINIYRTLNFGISNKIQIHSSRPSKV